MQLTLLRGRPVSDPERVPTLLGRHGGFPAQARDVFLSWIDPGLEPRGDRARVRRPGAARARAAGLRPDHLNTQHHIGCIPPVGLAVEAVARRHGIPGVRSAVEEPTPDLGDRPAPRGAGGGAGRPDLVHPAAHGRAPPRAPELGLCRERTAGRGPHPGDPGPPGPGQPRADLPPRRARRSRRRGWACSPTPASAAPASWRR